MSRFVLVHGSWHGAWVWDRIIPLLQVLGHDVAAPNLPGRGGDSIPPEEVKLEDHVRRVTEVIQGGGESAILVGHSFGGAVISHVAEQIPERIDLLVYLAGFLLQEGQSVLDVALSGNRDDPYLEIDRSAGVVRVARERAREIFYHDCSPQDAEMAAARLVPEAIEPRVTSARITQERFGRVPRVFFETVRDRGLPVGLQRAMQASLPCRDVISLDSGHSPFLSMPDLLAGQLHLCSIRYWS